MVTNATLRLVLYVVRESMCIEVLSNSRISLSQAAAPAAAFVQRLEVASTERGVFEAAYEQALPLTMSTGRLRASLGVVVILAALRSVKPRKQPAEI
jgi:hypothetical protein